jgi:hypothetical protein
MGKTVTEKIFESHVVDRPAEDVWVLRLAETFATADVARRVVHIRAGAKAEEIPFALSDFDRQLVEAGGWLEYADARY